MFQVQPACDSPFLFAARQLRAGCEVLIASVPPGARLWGAVMGRLVLRDVFSLGFSEAAAGGPHVPTSVSQRAFSSRAEGENPTSYSFYPEL